MSTQLMKALRAGLGHTQFYLEDGQVVLRNDPTSRKYAPTSVPGIDQAAFQSALSASLKKDNDALIEQERDRRMLEGSTFTLQSGKQLRLRGDALTRQNLGDLAGAATAASVRSIPFTVSYRDADNVTWVLDADEIVDLFLQATRYVSDIFNASFTLKSLADLPTDYTSDARWS